MGLDQMRHRAADAAMAVAHSPPWVLSGISPLPEKMARAHASRRLAASGLRAEVFQQHRQRDRKLS